MASTLEFKNLIADLPSNTSNVSVKKGKVHLTDILELNVER